MILLRVSRLSRPVGLANQFKKSSGIRWTDSSPLDNREMLVCMEANVVSWHFIKVEKVKELEEPAAACCVKISTLNICMWKVTDSE